MAVAQRGRFSGNSEDLAAVILPYVQDGGRSWLRYSDGKVGDGQIDKKAIEKHKAMIGELYKLQENLVFKVRS